MKRLRHSDIGQLAVLSAVIVGVTVAVAPQSVPAPADGGLAAAGYTVPAREQSLRSALFIGDSYTAGKGSRELSPACIAATRLGLLCQLSALPGTGYISGGPANRFTLDAYSGPSSSFSERIPRLAMVYHPDIVVLDGGRNDDFPPRKDVFKAMAATIADARQAWPQAVIVFVRPRFLADPRDDLGFDDAFVTLLRRGPTHGVIVIDPIRTLAGNDTSALLGADGVHPNEKGETALASAMTAELSDQRILETR
ncbi:MAG: SGNH/GDSL hydrolase family protein [Mycobacterium sp.]|nr:SGNH/GDSL hydrolase family protein [Mycobacterium sp.]